MKIQLGLRDFQSIEKAVLTFEPGVTLISGANGSGKTAIFRGLKSLILNHPSAKHFIRAGASNAMVAVRFGDSPAITWIREPTGVTYKIGSGEEAQKYTKSGRTNIFDLDPKFPIVLDEQERVLNLHGEWDKLFPFDKSPADLFKLFEGLFQITGTTTVLSSMKEDETNEKTNLIKNQDTIASITNKVTKLKELELNKEVERLNEVRNEIDSFLVELKNLEESTKQSTILYNTISLIKDFKAVSYEFKFLDGFKTLKEDAFKAQGLSSSLSIKVEKEEWDFSFIDSLNVLRNEVVTATTLLRDINYINEQQKSQRDQLQSMEQSLSQYSVCPACGSELIDHEQLEAERVCGGKIKDLLSEESEITF